MDARSKSSIDELKEQVEVLQVAEEDRFDPLVYYERNAGRLVIDPE